MKRTAQNAITVECMRRYHDALDEMKSGRFDDRGQLRSCKARVYETDTYWILQSYGTFVAVTSKATGVCYDVLRIVYGYTATSAQHIAKFRHDFHTPEYKFDAPSWIAR